MILAIDDDPDVLFALSRCLVHAGYRVATTEDAEEAFAIMAREPVRVLISDIDMPAMNGLEVVRRARKLHPGIARVLLTGFGTFDAAQRAINEGEVHRFLTKPFDPAELSAVIAEAAARADRQTRVEALSIRDERRQHLLASLESEHPQITQLPRDAQGAYIIDADGAEVGKRLLGAPLFDWLEMDLPLAVARNRRRADPTDK